MKFQLNDIIWPGVSWIFTISNIDDDNIRGWFVLYQLNLRPSEKKKYMHESRQFKKYKSNSIPKSNGRSDWVKIACFIQLFCWCDNLSLYINRWMISSLSHVTCRIASTPLWQFFWIFFSKSIQLVVGYIKFFNFNESVTHYTAVQIQC